MISLREISLQFGERKIFDKISINLDPSEKIGLVGRNGAGKSTLLKVIAKQNGIGSGEILISKGCSVGYVPQELTLISSKSIFEETFEAFEDIVENIEKIKILEKKLESTSSAEDVELYAQLQHKLSQLEPDQAKAETEKMLLGLGFLRENFSSPVEKLSVGWKMRIVLAKLLLRKADFYLFDEPTNHLDIVAKEWFGHFLKNANFGFLLVCHDKYFLDHLCTKILELENGKATLYVGNFVDYQKKKEQNAAILLEQKKRQDAEIAKKLKTAERFRAGTKAKMAKAIFAQVEKIDRIEIESEQKTINIKFPSAPPAGKVVLTVQNLENQFNNKTIFKNVSFELKNKTRAAIVAANGVGKTTLLNLINQKLTLQGGTVTFGYNVIPAYFEQDQNQSLNPKNTILEEVLSACKNGETMALARSFLGSFLFSGDDVNKKISMLSGGEKNRVAMVKVLLQQANFIILDEPTNHLDIESAAVLLHALQKFPGTILFVSHDRNFIENLATEILELSSTGLNCFPGNYQSFIYHKELISAEQEKGSNQTTKASNLVVKKDAKLNEKNQNLIKLENFIAMLEDKLQNLQEELEIFDQDEKRLKITLEKIEKTRKDLNKAIDEWEKLNP